MAKRDTPSRRNAGLSERLSSDDARALAKQDREDREEKRVARQAMRRSTPTTQEAGARAMGEALARLPQRPQLQPAGPLSTEAQAVTELRMKVQRQRYEIDQLYKRLSDVWPPRKQTGSDETTTTEGEKFFARIGFPITKDGSNYRWSYTIVAVEKTAVGFGGWTATSGQLAGLAYNTIEDFNDATGPFGNGINSLPEGFEIKNVPIGTVVEVTTVNVGGVIEYHFQYENAVDGTCPDEEVSF